MKFTADVITAKRKRKIITPTETKTITYTENDNPKSSEQTVSPAKRAAEQESKLNYSIAFFHDFLCIFEKLFIK